MLPAKLSVIACALLIGACAAGPKPDADRSAPPTPSESPPAPVAPMPPKPSPDPVDPPAPSLEGKDLAAPVTAVSAAPVRVPPANAEPARGKTASVAPKPVVAAANTTKPVRPPVASAPATKAAVPTNAPDPAPGLPVTSTQTGRISGQIELVAGAGQTLGADEMSHAVVYFVSESAKTKVQPGRYQIYTHNKQFDPQSMVIPVGSTISFPNQDEILHNVFSVTPQSAFDLGIYGEGKSAEYTFRKTGLVLINCNVHQAMQANVLVVDTPFVANPGKDGRFALADLPSGSGKLVVWHPRATLQSQPFVVPQDGQVALRLVLTKPRIAEHLNKESRHY